MARQFIPQLTFPRFLAALLVVATHYGQHVFPFRQHKFFTTFTDHAHICLSYFFVLSGAILFINYYEKGKINIKDFTIKRFARIYPLYFLAFVLTLFLMMWAYNSFPKGYSIVLQLFTLHTWVPGIALEINYPSWSVSNEVFFYALFPMLLVWFKRMTHTQQYIFTIVFWIISSLQHYFAMSIYHGFAPENMSIVVEEFINAFPLWNLNAFIVGILCGRFIIDKQDNPMPVWIPRAMYISGLIGIYLFFYFENPLRPFTHNGLVAPFFFIILAGMALDNTSWFIKLISKKVAVILGEASFSIYLLQFPVYIVFSEAIGHQKLTTYEFYTYLLILVIVSLVVLLFYENIMRIKILNKFLKRPISKV